MRGPISVMQLVVLSSTESADWSRTRADSAGAVARKQLRIDCRTRILDPVPVSPGIQNQDMRQSLSREP